MKPPISGRFIFLKQPPTLKFLQERHKFKSYLYTVKPLKSGQTQYKRERKSVENSCLALLFSFRLCIFIAVRPSQEFTGVT